jgi:hypothetical protein
VSPNVKIYKLVQQAKESFFQFSNGNIMHLPVSELGYILVDLVFIPHDEEWITFGLFFLDHFSVSFDLKKGVIYFEPK